MKDLKKVELQAPSSSCYHGAGGGEPASYLLSYLFYISFIHGLTTSSKEKKISGSSPSNTGNCSNPRVKGHVTELSWESILEGKYPRNETA